MAQQSLNWQSRYHARWMIQDIPSCEARMIIALRMAVLAQKYGQDPAAHVAGKLGSQSLARHFAIVLEAMADAWGDAFHVARPCCARLTCDEQLCVQMFRRAVLRQQREFDGLTCEMMDAEMRERLYDVFCEFSNDYLALQARH